MSSAIGQPNTFTIKQAKESIARIKSALVKFESFAFIENFRKQFHSKFHSIGQQPGYTDLLTAMIGVEKLSEVEHLNLETDENIPWSQVVKRRKHHAESLANFIKSYAPALSIDIPDNLIEQCAYMVELVQPTAIAEDKYMENFHVVAQAKAEGRLDAKFYDVYENLVDNPEPIQAYVYQALGLHFLADEVSLPPEILKSGAWELLKLEVGMVAVSWINTKEKVKVWRGINALFSMYQLGEIYSGVQLAQSLFSKVSPARIDKPFALHIIENTFDQYLQCRNFGPVFTCKESEGDLFRNYNTIVCDAIRDCDDPEEIERLIVNLLNVLIDGAEKRLEGFAACVLSILTPDFPPLHGIYSSENECFFSLRRKISGYPIAELHCLELAESMEVKRLQASFY